MDFCKGKLPLAKIFILTNGTLLTENDIITLQKYNILSIQISAYGKKEEYENLKKQIANPSIPINIHDAKLDNRENIYQKEPADLIKPCFATIRDITVNCHGQISLCCLDWNNKEIFGDLYANTLSEILNTKKFQDTHKALINGIRKQEICRRCTWQR